MQNTQSSFYAPWLDKVTCQLDLMDSLLHQKFSVKQLDHIIEAIKDVTEDLYMVPTRNSLRRSQKETRKLIYEGDPVKAFVSGQGNHFSIFDPRETISLELCNPRFTKIMHFYPEVQPTAVGEVWEAGRWMEYEDELLAPMWISDRLDQYYIHEVAQLLDGRFVIPLRWVTIHGIVHARSAEVINQGDSWQVACNGEWSDIPAELLKHPLTRLQRSSGAELAVVFVSLWVDDVSGNKIFMQESAVNFVATSQNASGLEMLDKILTLIKETEGNPIRTFNAHTHRDCRVVLHMSCLPCNNPQANEHSSHIHGGNHRCRCCRVGGSIEERCSPEGFAKLHTLGPARMLQDIKEASCQQLEAMFHGKSLTDLSKLHSVSGTKDPVLFSILRKLQSEAVRMKRANPQKPVTERAEDMRKLFSELFILKEHPLNLIEGLDPARDTPVEPLHTHYLGLVKYAWHLVVAELSKSSDLVDKFIAQLASADMSGVGLPPIQSKYIWQYNNNLIGCRYRLLNQFMAFQLHGLVGRPLFGLVVAMGDLGALISVPEIHDMEKYQRDLKTVIANVTDCFSNINPQTIIWKSKVHMMMHLPDDMGRFGPAAGISTEIQDKFNGVFHAVAIHGNALVPSRDIAVKFASMKGVAHLALGGFYLEKGEWKQVGPGVSLIVTQKMEL
ncbi:hypothetical protein C356_03456 [Cryptococcus neoformans c45]|nr:hypothetical protein C356_03456 [Cryptococcus neoformans var. grubii c45]